MCATKTKVIIHKSKNGTDAKIMGCCPHCDKNHTIDLGDIQAALLVIKVFKMTQEDKQHTADGIIYTYS